ncbi:MAG: ATP-binding protein [Muribaculaceae bacterium]|nr:ATP-binding protein [Muribaculaceae bacterium]
MEQKRKGYIESLIEEGEHEHQDFKYQISDAKKIARSIAAFANHSGGHLLVGVKDNGHIAGVSSDEEIYMVEQAAQMYCNPPQEVKFQVYRVKGKNVVKATVDEADVKPVKAPDENSIWRVYYRVADENVLASSLHAKILKKKAEDAENALIEYGESERALLGYLESHGGITVTGYMKLARLTRTHAEASLVRLSDMGLIDLKYHNGECLIVAREPR